MTKKETIFNQFLLKIEKDKDFFSYFKLDDDVTKQLIQQRLENYYKEAIVLFCMLSEMDISLFKEVDFEDTNGETIKVIEEDLSLTEIDIIASLMREVHLERDYAELRAMMLKFSPKDLKVFSPANERKSFIEMVEHIKKENRILLDWYLIRDRTTGKRKQLGYL